MKQERIIREAIAKARASGVVVRKGATFDLTTTGPDGVPVRAEGPTACNATGAVLLDMGWRHLSPGWLSALCSHLDVDTFWLWRFWMGFDRGFQVQRCDYEGNPVADDEVSRMARRLARELAE